MKAFNLTELSQTLLCPPGNGVFTVSTAQDRKERLHQLLYPDLDPETAWKESLYQLSDLSGCMILGVPSDCGGGIQRGANWGPLFIREKLWQTVPAPRAFELGDVRVIPHLLHDKYLNEETLRKCRKALYSKDTHLPVSPLSITEYYLDQFYQQIQQVGVLALGGDHSVSYPLVGSYLRAQKRLGKKVALIHFDAHTDLLTERLGIDLCFGSWVPPVLQYLTSPHYCYQLGLRSSSKDKAYWQNKFGIQQFWAAEIVEQGERHITDYMIEDLKRKGVEALYISFDIDALDKQFAGATGTPEGAGLHPDQCMLILDQLNQAFPITGADLVEVAPLVWSQGISDQEHTLCSAARIGTFLIDALNHAFQ